LLAAVLVTAFFAGPALAADLPPAYPTKAPPMVIAATNWTGFYVGLNGGYGFGDNDGSVDGGGPSVLEGYTSGGKTTTFGTPVALGNWTTPSGFQHNDTGGVFGGQLGYNWQTGPLVFGAEADFQWSGIKGDQTINGAPPFSLAIPPAFGTLTNTGVASQSTSLDWFGTVRARVGLSPFSNMLFYGTGGLAFGHIKGETNITDNIAFTSAGGGFNATASFAQSGGIDETKIGWAAGLGAEYRFGQSGWSVGGEWLHLGFGDVTYALPTTQSGSLTNGRTTFAGNFSPIQAGSVTQSFGYDIFRLKANYAF